jgi:hypothetical protein
MSSLPLAKPSSADTYDGDMVRTLIAHRLARHCGDRDSSCVEVAATACLSEDIKSAERAGVTVEMSFGAGIELGVALAIAVINSPISQSEGLVAAIDAAKAELRAITQTAIADSKLIPRVS